MIEAIARVLRRGDAPSPRAVCEEMFSGGMDKRYSQFYFDKGGRVEFALDGLIQQAKEQSVKYGDGSFENDLGYSSTLKQIPRVSGYDDNYELLREHLLGSGFAAGPYESCEEHDEDDEEFSDEEDERMLIQDMRSWGAQRGW